MKRQWPLTWCKYFTHVERLQQAIGRAEPEDAAVIMGRIALASKTMTKGDWPEENAKYAMGQFAQK